MAPSKGNNNNCYNKKKEQSKKMLMVFKKKWAAEAETTSLKLGTSKSVQYYEKFNILKGNEVPELYLTWLQDYQSKITKNSQIPWTQQYDLILTMTNQVAKTTVQETYRSVLNPVFTDLNDRDDFDWKFPNWAKPFDLYSNASDVQLVATLV